MVHFQPSRGDITYPIHAQWSLNLARDSRISGSQPSFSETIFMSSMHDGCFIKLREQTMITRKHTIHKEMKIICDKVCLCHRLTAVSLVVFANSDRVHFDCMKLLPICKTLYWQTSSITELYLLGMTAGNLGCSDSFMQSLPLDHLTKTGWKNNVWPANMILIFNSSMLCYLTQVMYSKQCHGYQ